MANRARRPCARVSAGTHGWWGLDGHPRGLRPSLGDEGGVVLEFRPVAALAHEGLVEQAFSVTMTWASAVHDKRDIGAGPEAAGVYVAASMCGWRTMGRCALGIDDDQLRALAQGASLRREAKTGWPSVGLAPMDDHDVGVLRRNRNSACRPRCRTSASGHSRRRMADAVRRCRHCCFAETLRADQLLDEIWFSSLVQREEVIDCRRWLPLPYWYLDLPAEFRPATMGDTLPSQLTSPPGIGDLSREPSG